MKYEDAWDVDPEDDGPYESLFSDCPLNEFIHERFCSIYPCHGWAHDGLVRALLATTFTSVRRPPAFDEFASIFVLAKDLKSKLNGDIWENVCSHLTRFTMRDWVAFASEEEWIPEFSNMNPFPRCVVLSLADVARFGIVNSFLTQLPTGWADLCQFYVDPLPHCPAALDILRLPLLQTTPRINSLPLLDPSTCLCGQCGEIEQLLVHNSDLFRLKYYEFIREGKERGCTALELCWELFLVEAEDWMDELVSRVESPSELFLLEDGKRAGPLIFDAANELGIPTTPQASSFDVLRLLTWMRTISINPADVFATPDQPIKPASLPSDGIGYLLVPDASNDQADVELVCGGNWLPQLAGRSLEHPGSKMAVMPRTDGLDIPVIPIFPLCEAITPLCMPILPMSRSPLRLPHRHDLEDPVWHEMSSDHATPYIQNMTVELSRFEHDGFPLFSLWTGDKEKSSLYPPGCLAAKLSSTYERRTFETWWRPYVSIGQKCDHSDLYGQGIRCSMTCRDTLCQLKGPSPPFSERLEALRSRLDDEPRLQKDLAQLLLNELDARTGRLKERGGPFERNRAMMVRCNDEDPILPLVLLGASCGRRFYLLHHQECWDCACLRMQEDFCTVGIALGTSRFTTCDACLLDTERAEHIALEHGF